MGKETQIWDNEAQCYRRAVLHEALTRVRLSQRMTGDSPFGNDTVAEAGVYEAHLNPQGAVSIVAANGKLLGLKPGEFTWESVPAAETPRKENNEQHEESRNMSTMRESDSIGSGSERSHNRGAEHVDATQVSRGRLSLTPLGPDCFAPVVSLDSMTNAASVRTAKNEASHSTGRTLEEMWELNLCGHQKMFLYAIPEVPTGLKCALCRIKELEKVSERTLDEERAPEEIAQKFHETYERLAPQFGYETRKESAKPWSDVPDKNKRLMIAVCAEVQAWLAARGKETHK